MSNYVTVTSCYSKKTAFWLCVFGGIVGLHYFYVGRRFRGWVAAFTGNWLGFGWLLDLSAIRRGRFYDQYGDYLKM